jgi:hypothetical protein
MLWRVKTIPILALAPALLLGQTSVLLSRMAPAGSEPTADANSAFWRSVPGVVMNADYFGVPVPNHQTEVRSRWTAGHLYLLFICNYDVLNLKPDPSRLAETLRT